MPSCRSRRISTISSAVHRRRTNIAAIAVDTDTQASPGQNIMRQVSASVTDAFLTDDWWQVSILRVTGLADPYSDPVFVQSVSITYEAHS